MTTVTKELLESAYQAVQDATKAVFETGLQYESYKDEVEKLILKHTASGEIVGKNEQERKAMAFQMFANSYEATDKAEKDYKTAQNALSLAQLHLAFLRDCIRIEELAAKITG